MTTKKPTQLIEATITYARKLGGLSGDSAGNEPAEPSGAKYAEDFRTRLRRIATALYLATETYPDDNCTVRSVIEEAVDALEDITQEIGERDAEKRISRGEAPDGSAAQNAKAVTHVMRVGGLQLIFSLHCAQCGFEVWQCPECSMVRCRCARCSCVLDVNSKSTNT